MTDHLRGQSPHSSSRVGQIQSLNARRKLRIHKPAAGDVEAGPGALAPADFDGARAAAQLEQHLLAGLELPAIQETQAAARDVGREDFAFDRLGLRRSVRRKDDGAGPPAKWNPRVLPLSGDGAC